MPKSSSVVPDNSPVVLPPGTVLAGKYRVDGFLGLGGMGVVLSATNLDLDAPVAIKVLRDELSKDEQIIARMLLEARSVAKLRSAHVVRVLDVSRMANGTPYIVMERLEGSDLGSLLTERGALTTQEAVDYVVQACEGLAEAHALGIIHRDLKPENLFVAETPEGPLLKILDFGISKDGGNSKRIGPRSALTNAGRAVGSPHYMSPEQMRASRYVDARADIWSLGAVLFELLTGKCPFEGESIPVVCAKVLSTEAPTLRSFSEHAPERLDAIVQCCLEKDPNARFGSVLTLAAALRDFALADLERAADRSSRIASGISFVRQKRAKVSTPGCELHGEMLCSSPTLESDAGGLPGTFHVGDSPARRAASIVAVGLAFALGSGAGVLGSHALALSASNRLGSRLAARMSATAISVGSNPVGAGAKVGAFDTATGATASAKPAAARNPILTRWAAPARASAAIPASPATMTLRHAIFNTLPPSRVAAPPAEPTAEAPDDPEARYGLSASTRSGTRGPVETSTK